MIEERGRIVKVESGFVWVETDRKSTCGECASQNTCGTGLINKLSPSRQHAYIRATSEYPVHVGDEVTLALPENSLLLASFLMYLLPLLMMLAGAVLGAFAGAGEPVVIGLSLLGLLAGFVCARMWSGHAKHGRRFQPRVLYWHVPLATAADA